MTSRILATLGAISIDLLIAYLAIYLPVRMFLKYRKRKLTKGEITLTK